MPGPGRRGKPGRPRLTDTASTLPPREQIIETAADLFANSGFARTSTRDIAEQVGLRQASLYYHFPAGKEEILNVLLERTVRPTIDQIDMVDDVAVEHGWAAALYALVMIDTRTLAEAPHNAGRLASLPDVRSLPLFEPYRSIRTDLSNAYQRYGRKVAGLDEISGILLTNLVEVVTTFRAEGDDVDEPTRHMIAATVLRVCGAPQEAILLASAVAWAELLQ